MRNGLVSNTSVTKRYYKDVKLRGEDVQEIFYLNGDIEYHINGKRHREDGPAVIYADGDIEDCIEGKRHREDGPAVIGLDGTLEYWIEGKFVDEYRPGFGCFEPKSREDALERLDSKERPFTREMYLADINKRWPIEEN